MNIGWVGLGRLGLPCALALQRHGGHSVMGCDLDSGRVRSMLDNPADHGEAGLADLLRDGLKLASGMDELVQHSNVVFVAVQTPHDPAFDGSAPVVGEPRDFEYGYLVQAVRDLAAAVERHRRPVTVVVVSTVLPGTVRTRLAPLCGPLVSLVYSPAFIAMGTAVKDWTSPELVLIGADSPLDAAPVQAVFTAMHDRPVKVVSIESAELAKVAYNTLISMKIVYGNLLGEIAEKTGADCDQVVDALSLATQRVVSPAYLRAGMGDGGGCHPRDGIAMSWLAKHLDLSVDLMGFLTQAREAQSRRLASTVLHWARLTGLPVIVLGKAYKPGSALTAGSPASLLVAHLDQIGARPWQWLDPHTDHDQDAWLLAPAVYVVATKHPEFAETQFPANSVVIDPHGCIPDTDGVTVHRIGRKKTWPAS